mgnify:FL=1
MKLIVERIKEIYDGTIGRFRLVSEDGRLLLEGFTLEPAGPDTVERGRDKRIPAGVYQTTWHESGKFQRLLPLLYNEKVPKDRCILIHSGNIAKDTQGCILLGNKADEYGVCDSKMALEAFLKLMFKKEFQVEITNKF